jgi:hypothetical protein
MRVVQSSDTCLNRHGLRIFSHLVERSNARALALDFPPLSFRKEWKTLEESRSEVKVRLECECRD